MNVFHNYIPNKTILCNDKVPLSLIMKLEKYVLKKNEIFEQYIANGKS